MHENKDKSLFKNKFQMVVYLILFAVFIYGFIYLGTKDYSQNGESDNLKISEEHAEINSDNIFKYINSAEAYDYVKNDDIMILFGVKNNHWVGYYANLLNDVAKNVGISEIYYYDITDDRADNNATYESIVEYLNDYVTSLDDETKDIYGPTLLVKKDGIILLYDDETSLVKGSMTPEKYYNNYMTNLKIETLTSVLTNYLGVSDGE